ncbi:MAG: hypothetical protein R3Y16_06805 [Rikenellaceae bacterium]
MKNFTKSLFCAATLCASVATSAAAENKPEVNVGLLLHTYATAQQAGFGEASAVDGASEWSVGASLYRARVLFETKLTDKDYVFIETDLSASVGLGADKAASIKILDAQYEHKFGDFLTIAAGKMLISYNRNGLQTAGTLMANDFSYFQYAYNMSQDSPLQNDCGRDIGVNFLGSIIPDKLKYRIGAFSGRRDFENSDKSTLRFVGRVTYNFFDDDCYSGTNLGQGKTFTLGAGFDTQGTYHAFGVDAYLDAPMGEAGSVTANLAYSYMTGGDDLTAKYSFASMIPAQNIIFAELGYYFKETKLQPWVKYELQSITDGADENVFGAGLNYFFNGYGSNLRLSYVARQNSVVGELYGQIWLQAQIFIF